MLQPSENFTAKEIQFLQNHATEWIQKVNAEIIRVAENGGAEARISVYDHIKQEYTEFMLAPRVLIEHFKHRGFDAEMNGQSALIIKW